VSEAEVTHRSLQREIAKLSIDEPQDLRLDGILSRTPRRRHLERVHSRRPAAPFVLLAAAARAGLVASDVHGQMTRHESIAGPTGGERGHGDGIAVLRSPA